jgi:hypothetical protein
MAYSQVGQIRLFPYFSSTCKPLRAQLEPTRGQPNATLVSEGQSLSGWGRRPADQ